MLETLNVKLTEKGASKSIAYIVSILLFLVLCVVDRVSLKYTYATCQAS